MLFEKYFHEAICIYVYVYVCVCVCVTYISHAFYSHGLRIYHYVGTAEIRMAEQVFP